MDIFKNLINELDPKRKSSPADAENNPPDSNENLVRSGSRRGRPKKKAPQIDPPENIAPIPKAKVNRRTEGELIAPRKAKAGRSKGKNGTSMIPIERGLKKEIKIGLYTDRNPWDYHPWETMASFAAFQIYLRLSPHMRSTSRVKFELFKLTYPDNPEIQDLKFEDWVRSDLNSKAMGVSNTIVAWSSKYYWVERATAWDSYLAKVEQQALIEKRKKMAQKCIDLGSEISEAGIDGIRTLKRMNKVPSYDVSVKMVEAGVKLEKSGLGLDEVIQPQVNVNVSQKINVDKLSNEELDSLIKMQSKTSINEPGNPVMFNLENVIEHGDL